MSHNERIKELVTRHSILLLVIAVVLALALRFVNLGSPTLSDNEAQNALQVLGIIRGQSTIIGGQPGYVGLTSFLFFLFGSSDFFARFWPALFGAGLVLVPSLFRKQLDEPTRIILAFLIALEPGLVGLSRSADGTMIMISSLLAAIGFLQNKKLIPAGVFFGLSLISSENLWPLVLTLTLSGTLLSVFTRKKVKNQFRDILEIEKSRWWILALSTVISMGLISTQLFFHPNAISGIGSGLVDYWQSWTQTGEMSMGSFVVSLLVTQLPAILLGVWGLIHGIKSKSRTTLFLGLWWGIGLILGLLNPSHNAWSIVLIDLPVFILAALQLKTIMEDLVVQSTILTLIETVITFTLILFSTLNFLNMINVPTADPIMFRNRLIGTLLPLALWIAFSALLAWGWDVTSTKSGLMIGIGLILGAILVGSGWKAAGFGDQPENEILSNSGYVIGEDALLKTISDVSRWNTGQATRIDIDLVGLDSSSLIWSLRDFEKITADSSFPINTTTSIVVSGLESMTQTQSLYRGQLVGWSVQPDYAQMGWQDWIKWGFLRNIPQQKEYILLWVRNDLFRDVSSQLP